MAVHVSIHDVSPATEREVDAALAMTHAAGVKPALLVVPDFHGKAPLEEHPKYVDKLRALEEDGHEIYLHGYYHRSNDPPADAGARAKIHHLYTQKVVSASEAEFSAVTRDEAIDRLDRGEELLRKLGLTIRGFVAPAWSMPDWVLTMLGDRGYRFTEDHLRVHDPAGKRSRPSVVLNFASRSPARLFSTVLWCRLARPARRFLPARIAIHPGDMRFALLRSEIASLLEWGRNDFVPTGDALLR